jgi:NitT/TauT family transport system substrate-binding protein
MRVGAGAGAVAAMRSGQIDAIALLDPTIHVLEAAGDIVPVVDTRTDAGMKYVYGDDYAAGVIYGRSEFIDANPQTVQAVVNAMVRALQWLTRATPDEIVATVPPDYYGEQRDQYRAALLKNLAALSRDGLMTPAAAQNVLAVLKGFDPAVQAARSIDLSATYDNRFVLAAPKRAP